MNWPSLSILIPSYNQGHYIERTLLSIIRQDYPGDLQIIVSDGGSNDGTVDVLEKYASQITWWSQPDNGFADAVNKALAAATGEIVAIQSSDDFYLKGAFETAIRALMKKPELGFVTGADIVVRDELPPKLRPRASQILSTPVDLLANGSLAQHCTFVRREAMDKVDGLRESVDQCADFDLWYRILHFYQGLILSDYLAVYQIHSAQRTQHEAQLWIDSLSMVIDSCKSDEKYAREFVLSAATEKEFRKAVELTWYWIAGDAESRILCHRLAREVIKEGDVWSERLRYRAYSVIERVHRDNSLLLKLRAKLRLGTRLRRLAGRPPRVAEAREIPGIDIDWWQPAKRVEC